MNGIYAQGQTWSIVMTFKNLSVVIPEFLTPTCGGPWGRYLFCIVLAKPLPVSSSSAEQVSEEK